MRKTSWSSMRTWSRRQHCTTLERWVQSGGLRLSYMSEAHSACDMSAASCCVRWMQLGEGMACWVCWVQPGDGTVCWVLQACRQEEQHLVDNQGDWVLTGVARWGWVGNTLDSAHAHAPLHHSTHATHQGCHCKSYTIWYFPARPPQRLAELFPCSQ
jgi:hypothetical protein